MEAMMKPLMSQPKEYLYPQWELTALIFSIKEAISAMSL